MASRSIDLGGLPPIQQGGFDVDALVKIAALMQNQHDQTLKDIESKSKYGTPATPTMFSPTPKKGFSLVPSAGDIPQPMMPGQDGSGALLVPPTGGTGAAPPIYAREGTPPIMGSVEFSQRNAMAGNVLTPDKSDEELQAQAQLLYGEPGATTLSKLKFSAKTAKPLHVISDLESQMLAGLGVQLDPGKVLTGDEFTSLHRLIGLRTQGRLAENQELILKKLGYDITNIRATIEEKTTDIEKKKESLKFQKKAMEILGGDASKTGDPLLTGGAPAISGITLPKATGPSIVEPKPTDTKGAITTPPAVMRALIQNGDGSEVDASDGYTYTYIGGTVSKKKTKRK